MTTITTTTTTTIICGEEDQQDRTDAMRCDADTTNGRKHTIAVELMLPPLLSVLEGPELLLLGPPPWPF